MSEPPTLTVVMSVGGDREADEPVAVYADMAQAEQAADDFNRRYDLRAWECAWQYTKTAPFVTLEAHDRE